MSDLIPADMHRCMDCQRPYRRSSRGSGLCDGCEQDRIDDAMILDDDEPEDDFEDECGLMRDGQCTMAGTEHCDFECPNRESELFCGSAAWHRKQGKK